MARLAWALRPIGFVGAVTATAIAFLSAVAGEWLVVGAMLAILVGCGWLLQVVAVSVRTQRLAATASDVTADEHWRKALAAGGSRASGLSPRAQDLVSQVRSLDGDQRDRLLAEARLSVRLPVAIGLGGLLVTAAAGDSSVRAQRARQDAVQAAREAIVGHGLIPLYQGTLDEALVSDDARTNPLGSGAGIVQDEESETAVKTSIDWAVLAIASEPWITEDEYAAIYGPWWRAVVRGVDAIWGGRWNAISLSGSWITVAGLILAPVMNRGDTGNLTLAIIVVGVTLLFIGTTIGIDRSALRPAPTRSHRPNTSLSVSQLARVWRLPERIVGWFTHGGRGS